MCKASLIYSWDERKTSLHHSQFTFPDQNWLLVGLTAQNNVLEVPQQMLVWGLPFDLPVAWDSYRAGDAKPTNPLFLVLEQAGRNIALQEL